MKRQYFLGLTLLAAAWFALGTPTESRQAGQQMQRQQQRQMTQQQMQQHVQEQAQRMEHVALRA